MLLQLLSLAAVSLAGPLNLTQFQDISDIHFGPIHGPILGNIFLKDRPLRSLKLESNLFGNREVAYFKTSNNLAIIDGDVAYGTVDDLLAHRNGPVHKRAFSGSGAWPNAQIDYKYDTAATENAVKAFFNDGAGRWLAQAPYLKFNQLPNSAVWTKGVLTITSNDCDGCHASYGYDANSPQWMNLDQKCESCNGDVAVHEIGHVLGLYHEHQRPDREAHVQYHCENLRPDCENGAAMAANTNCCNNVVGDCCKAGSNFGFFQDASLDWSGPYDVGSVMHYAEWEFALAGQRTLTTSDPAVPVPVALTTTPSTEDFNRVCKRYEAQCHPKCANLQCPPTCTIVRPCTASHGCRPPREGDNDGWEQPECCHPAEANEVCKAWQGRCRAAGCPV